MSQKAIREFDGKLMLARWLKRYTEFKDYEGTFVQVSPDSALFDLLPKQHPWLATKKLVVKPDQLIKRRGKSGLILLNSDWESVSKWIAARINKDVTVEQVSGVLTHFLVEPFVPHSGSDEYYICLQSKKNGDEILFHHAGGVDVGDVDAKAVRMLVPVGTQPTAEDITAKLLQNIPEKRRAVVASYIRALCKFTADLHFSYLEINPLVVMDDATAAGGVRIIPLDMAARIDEAAKFECGKHWGPIDFPPSFGRAKTEEEALVAELDGKTGASLKLTVLNPAGRIWTMVAGGGSSVIYADTIADLGAGMELANYGEYSGAPTEGQTFEYAKTILGLMTKVPHQHGKILIIGGGIANFTDVAATFKGIIRALRQFADVLIKQGVRIYVRRGGPNYQEGLENMRKLAREAKLTMEVYGPETHMTAVCAMALDKPVKSSAPKLVPQLDGAAGAKRLLSVSSPTATTPAAAPTTATPTGGSAGSPAVATTTAAAATAAPVVAPAKPEVKTAVAPSSATAATATATAAAGDTKDQKSGGMTRTGSAGNLAERAAAAAARPAAPWYDLFTSNTKALVYGLQTGAVQHMLDFDFICNRREPSVAGLVYEFEVNHFRKFYWNKREVLLPIYQDLGEALRKMPEVDVVVNFASFRSVFESTKAMLQFPQIRTIAIIAEGVPERHTRQLIAMAKARGVTMIGPATVGGVKPGAFRLGNAGGMLDNIIDSRLYRPGSVAYVARSGGMSNELNNIIARNSDGVCEGIAIGGDRYPSTGFLDHLLRFEANPNVKMMVVLGEVGGVEEYEIVDAIAAKRLTKPIVAWCVGTCASLFPYEVQFGHAGACANAQIETAAFKNASLRKAGCHVPASFDDFGALINDVYCSLVNAGTIVVKAEVPPPTIPVDYEWAKKLGLVRKPAQFISSIVDERGDELVYGGMKISDVVTSEIGIGGVIGLIWFRKRLPDYFNRFIEMVLQITADHGPAVSGAHNTIVCARAGKDLVSSLVSGLLTIGPRFGGALDGSAQQFSWGYDQRLAPEEFVERMRRQKELIMGIGHRVKSLENPDVRVTLVKSYVRKHFKVSDVFDYACEIEKVTTKKKSNLILNVDGAIACAFVDLLRGSGAFTLEEANEYIKMGILNGLFVLGRSIGFIGHYIDQLRLKQGLYRHPTEDISYLVDQSLDL